MGTVPRQVQRQVLRLPILSQPLELQRAVETPIQPAGAEPQAGDRRLQPQLNAEAVLCPRFEVLQAEDPDAVEFYRADAYNAAAALQDNILFGRIVYGQAEAAEIVGRAVTEVLDDLGLRPVVMEIGLDYQVGIGGKRLSSVQRQKLALARALIKQPDVLVVNEAVAVMDGSTQTRLLDKILAFRKGKGIIWTLQRPSMAEHFERLIVMQGGRAVEQGDYSALTQPGSAFSRLVAAE